MSEMIERMAKAHYERLHYTAWENLTPSTREGFLAAMRAAIEAMEIGECICPKCGLRHGMTNMSDAGF